MRALRPFLWAAILVGAFLYVTSVGHWNVSKLLAPPGQNGHIWESPAAAASGFSAEEQNNIDVYKAAREATVNITSVVYRENFFMQVYPSEGTGSGFLLNADGEVLTNNHVVNHSAKITVTLADKKVYTAHLLGADSRDDLALIKIDTGRKLPAMHLGDSDSLVVGQKVLAIGNPFGFEGTLTTGIVSSLNRTIQTEASHALEGMIQTDAAINPGNSGGPLLDSHGNVIGINTAIYGQGNIGIGFAMPINRAKSMLDEFQKHGHISRPVLGINEVWITGDLAEMLELPAKGGLLITKLERGSPAEESGLRGPTDVVIVGGTYQLPVGGDLIIAVEGQPVTTRDALQKVMDRKHGGDTLSLTIHRRGKTIDVKVKLGEAPAVL